MFNVNEYISYINSLFNDEYYKSRESKIRKKIILRIKENDEMVKGQNFSIENEVVGKVS